MSKAAIKQALKNTELFDARQDADTIRLWENYREQASLWRALALLQIPTTCVATMLTLYAWANTRPIINVPQKPLPGMYAAQEIPDTEFIEVAQEYVNLIASYQPITATRQFEEARKHLIEPVLTVFNTEMMNTELQAIMNTSRSQMFLVDPSKTELKREGRDVRVTMVGDRFKLVAGKEVPTIPTKFEVIMTTIPRNSLNPYGIVIKNVVNTNAEIR